MCVLNNARDTTILKNTHVVHLNLSVTGIPAFFAKFCIPRPRAPRV